MGKNKEETTQQTEQQFQQQQSQSTEQSQQQVQAQQQATSNLQQFLNQFMNQSQQTQQQQQQQQSEQQGTQTSNLSPLQQPVVQQFFEDLMQQYTSGTLGPQAYTGERVAALTPQQQAAQAMMQNFAGGAGSDFANSALLANQRLLSPDMLDPSRVPGLQASKDANALALTRQLTEQQLPAIRSGALLDNSYGGSRQGIAEGLATGRTNEAIANANAGMDMQAYSQGLQAMQGALGLAPSTMNVGTAPAQLVGQVGQQNQAQQQAELDAQQEQFREEQSVPATTLGLLQNLMGVQGQYGGSTTTQQTGTQTGQQTGTQTGQQSGQQSGSQIAQQLASMLGINLAEMQGTSEGTSSGTQSGTSTQTTTTSSSPLQTIGALAGLAMMPWSFGILPGVAAAGAAGAAG